MNDTPNTPQRIPTFQRFVRGVFGRKGLYALIAFVTLISLGYAVENFRGRRAWTKYCQEAEARGLKLDFASHIPPQIPDSENGANTPTIQSWFPKPKPDDTNWFAALGKAASRLAQRKADSKRHMTDLVAWKDAFASLRPNGSGREDSTFKEQDRTPAERAAAAPAVLEALSIYEPIFTEFRAASRRPKVRYPVHYLVDEPYMILLPHLAKLKTLTQASSLRASANLAAGKTDAAFEDVLLCLWAAESLHEESFLINQLVRVACLQIAVQPVWEGLAEHRWSDAQLKILNERLAQIDLLRAGTFGFALERAAGVTIINTIGRRSGFEMFSTPEQTPKMGISGKVFGIFYPSGWRYMESVNMCRIFDAQELGVINARDRRIDSARSEQNNAALEAKLKSSNLNAFFNHYLFAKLLLPAINKFSRRIAAGQVMVDEARIACLIERYRLANGKLPESLEALSPGFAQTLPHDVLSGAPFKYERVRDDAFTLTSVGWAETRGSTPDERWPERPARNLGRVPEWVWHSAP